MFSLDATTHKQDDRVAVAGFLHFPHEYFPSVLKKSISALRCLGGDKIILPGCGHAVVPGEDRQSDNRNTDPIQGTAQGDPGYHLPCHVEIPHCISLFSRCDLPSAGTFLNASEAPNLNM
jgi:hypothetical protein